MTEVSELSLIRQHNIKLLKEDLECSNNKVFAEKVGLKYATLATCMREPLRGNIGDKVCEAIYQGSSIPRGWLDKDRRAGGNLPAVIDPEQTVISMECGTLTLKNHPITKYQRDRIIELLFAG